MYVGSRLKRAWKSGRRHLKSLPSSRTGENPPYGMIGGVEETSASFEARSAPRSYPTERILEQTFGVSEGVWLGTPFNLNLERQNGDLERRMAEIWHPHLVLWGEKDGWIAPADLKTMAAAMPDCRLVTVPGIGHSMNLESPALYAGYFGAWFGGLSGTEVAI